MTEKPNLDWYKRMSRECGEGARCPFATVEACPRYFQSLSLSADIGGTPMDPREDERLLKKWKASDLWPRTGEQASSVFKADDRLSFISNFCPEITYDRFGLFCESLSTYSDEIDIESAHRRLSKEGAMRDDARWSWQHITAQHYTDCPQYAVLKHRAAQPANKDVPWWREHLAKIAVGIVLAVGTTIVAKIFAS